MSAPPETEAPPSAPKRDPEELALRARPEPVARINRRVLVLLAGVGGFLIFGATLFALDPPKLVGGGGPGAELYTVENKPLPERLAKLPARYDELPGQVPVLGPPLPGDLGEAVLETERDLGLAPLAARGTPRLPFRPDPEDDAARSARIREARLEAQAREAGVFFELGAAAGRRAAAMPAAATAQGEAAPAVAAGSFDAISAAATPRLDREQDQNLQGRKLDFLGQGADAAIYNPHRLQEPASPWQVMAGTVIPASLVTGINSDLPGTTIAQVTENVYDTVTGAHLLIPQGARLIGTYDSLVAFGQSRALVVWQRIVMPDGSSIVIENLPASDAAGYAGLEDEVDFHTWRILKGVVLSTLLGAGTEITFGDDEGDLVRAIRESAQDSTNQAGQRITERNLNIQPTITVRPGWPLRVIVNRDLVLRPWRG